MYAMYYVSMLQSCELARILVRTNHPCLRVGRHTYFKKFLSTRSAAPKS
jgi:hypothetical protein